MTFHCQECGSPNVFCDAWVSLNDPDDVRRFDSTFCDNCEREVSTIEINDRKGVPMNPVETAVAHAMNEIRERLIDNLPKLPTTGICDCGKSDYFYVVEPGYWRTTNASVSCGTWTATADGWDDMTEEGAFEFMECGFCNAMYEKPHNIIWN